MEYEVPLSQILNDILKLENIHKTPSFDHTMTILPRFTFHHIAGGFQRAFPTSIACKHGTSNTPDTRPCPILDMNLFYLLRPIVILSLSRIRTLDFEHLRVVATLNVKTTLNVKYFCTKGKFLH